MNPRRSGTSNQRCSVSDFSSEKLMVDSWELKAETLKREQKSAVRSLRREPPRENSGDYSVRDVDEEKVKCERQAFALAKHAKPAHRGENEIKRQHWREEIEPPDQVVPAFMLPSD